MWRKNRAKARSELENDTSEEYSVTPNGVLKSKDEGAVPLYTGLCSTCNYAGECKNATNSTAPVIFCEEFDDFVEQKDEVAPEVTKPDDQMAKVADQALNAVKGLCVNCEHRDSCKFPIPESGVWFCEEYL